MQQFQFQNSEFIRSIWLPPLQFLLAMEEKYWQHHKNISASINYLICKYFLIDSSFQQAKIEDSLALVDSFLRNQLTRSHKIKAIQWFNSLLFNVAAINQDYEQSLSLSLLNSSNNNSKQQQSLILIETLQESQKQNFQKFLCLPSLLAYLNSIKMCAQPKTQSHIEYQHQHEIEFTLMSTIQYLCSKMEISVSYEQQIGHKLDQLRECECGCQEGVKGLEEGLRLGVNAIIFGNQDKRTKRLWDLVENNSNANLWSIASLVDANYKRNQAIRPIFSGTLQSGAQLIKQIIPKLVQVPKNNLFSEQMLSTNQVFQIFVSVFEFRHLNIYASWLKILTEYFDIFCNNSRKNKCGNLEFTKNVTNFIYMVIAQYDDFVEILRTLSKQLVDMGKYSKIVVLELLKKLVLNRFLLNPKLFYHYAFFNVEQQIVSVQFNKIRLLFYPKKCQNPQLLAHSQKLESAFSTLIFSSYQKSNQKTSTSKCVIYRLDYSLKSDYQTIYSDFLQKQKDQNQSHRTPAMSNSSYSLSFSFVKSPNKLNSAPKKSKRKNQQTIERLASPQGNVPSENCSINTILNKINGPENYQAKTHCNLGSPTSQKSKKTVRTEHTEAPLHFDPEMAMLQELVNKRRVLGTVRRAIEHRKAKKSQQRKKLNNFLSKVHYDFTTWRRQIQSEANRIRLEISLI